MPTDPRKDQRKGSALSTTRYLRILLTRAASPRIFLSCSEFTHCIDLTTLLWHRAVDGLHVSLSLPWRNQDTGLNCQHTFS